MEWNIMCGTVDTHCPRGAGNMPYQQKVYIYVHLHAILWSCTCTLYGLCKIA